jgi:hypothetical protein
MSGNCPKRRLGSNRIAAVAQTAFYKWDCLSLPGAQLLAATASAAKGMSVQCLAYDQEGVDPSACHAQCRAGAIQRR